MNPPEFTIDAAAYAERLDARYRQLLAAQTQQIADLVGEVARLETALAQISAANQTEGA
jgi:hypothetical protein